MSDVTVTVDAAGRATVRLELDLTREFGSNEAYHAFAQTAPASLMAGPLATRWARLAAAVELRQPGSGLPAPVPLAVTGVEPPVDATAADFASPFVWPRTGITLAGVLDRRYPVDVTFTKAFRLEEPIATRLVDDESGLRRSRWLVAGQVSPALPLEPASAVAAPVPLPWEAFWSYGRAGFHHILPLGVDHLLFVLLLFLASRRLGELLAQVSVFTLAHSVTLILASYRLIEVPASIVEPLIALSIVWVAVENLCSVRPGAPRYAVVFAFGLLHGLGFAGALGALGLPESHFFGALVAFNLGVEVGQLAFLLLLALLLGWYCASAYYRGRVVLPLSTLAAIVAGVWFVQRL